MSAIPTPDHRASGDGAPDQLDRQLGAFFSSEMPSPWPKLPAPRTVQPAMTVHRNGLSHSRLVLAASIASLLLGGWYLTGRLFAPMGTDASLREGSATVPLELRHGPAPPKR